MRLALRALLYRLNQTLARLGSRETWLLACILVVIIGAGQWGLSQVMGWQDSQQIATEIAANQQQTRELERSLADLQQQQANPQQQDLNQQIQRLQRDIERTNQAIMAVTDDLISPDQMVRVIRRLLDRQSGLHITSLETLPVTTTQGLVPGQADGTQLYRHAIQLELEGSFNATARYIQALENSEWRIYWDNLAFEIDQYPRGKVSIRLYTLSSEEGWLSV